MRNLVPRWAAVTAQIVVLAAIFVVIDLLGQYKLISTGNGVAIWASSGIALAAILLLGYHVWPGIFLGSFIANTLALARFAPHSMTMALLVGVGIGIGTTGQALLGAWLLQRTTGSRYPFTRVIDTVIFILLAGVVSSIISPSIGVASLGLGGFVPWPRYGYIWWAWWLSDMTGVLLVTPLLLTWAKPYRPTLSFSRVAEAAVLLCLGFIALLIVFGGGLFFGVINVELTYLIIPFLVWAALRFGRHGTTLAIFLIAGTVLWGTLHGFGPFVSINIRITLMELQGFLNTIAITGLILSVATAEQLNSRDTLQQLAETLEERVHDRTALLDSLNQQLQDELAARKRIEDQLRVGEEKFRALVEDITDWVWEVDEHGIYTYVSPKVYDLLGYTPEEVLGKTPFDFMPPDEAERVGKFFQDIAAEHEAFSSLENTNRRKDGHLVTVETNGRPIFDNVGHFRGYRGIDRDITERKKAEEALQREEALLSTAIDLLPFPILFLSPAMEPFRRNKALRDLFANEHVVTIAKSDLHILDPNTRTPIPQAQWPENRAARGEVIYAYEARLQLPSGREFPILGHAAPIYVNGNLIAVVVAFQDITALKEADRAKDQFLMILSHELKTPLTSILGWTQAARTNAEVVPQALEVVERNAREQQRILEDLLDVSRIVTGKLTIKPGPTDLWQLAAACADSSMHAAADRQIALVLDPPETPLPIYADPGRITEVIGNLLNNALKFTEPGGVITISGRREGGMAVLAVKDTGRGMDPELIPTLFRPFHQLQREEITGGLGLGLALVKGIIEIHGGQVSAASPGPGYGSTFTIKLPLRKDL